MNKQSTFRPAVFDEISTSPLAQIRVKSKPEIKSRNVNHATAHA